MPDQTQFEMQLENAIKLHSAMQIDQAISAYQKLIQEYPGKAVSHYYLAIVLLHKRDASASLVQMQKALEIEPEHPAMLAGMGDVLTTIGRLKESVPFYEKAIRLDPSSLPALLNLGANLNDLGRTSDSVRIFRQIVREHPDFQPGWNNLGNALIEIGRSQEAIEPLQKAIEIAPASFEAFSNLAKALNELGQNENAIAMARRALDGNSLFAPAWIQLGRAQLELGKPADAQKSLSKVLEIVPEAWPAMALLGSCCEELGDMRGAQNYWESCLRKKPDHAAVLGQMASRKKQKTPAGQVSQMQSLLDKSTTKAADKEHLAYGLAHYFDATGDFSKAAACLDQFSHLREVNLHARGLNYHPAEFQLHVQQILEIASAMPRFKSDQPQATRLIFITGMPRSGTSLAEQILASHHKIAGAGELTWIPDLVSKYCLSNRNTPDLEQIAKKIRADYFHRLAQAGYSGPFVVDKLPDNFFYLPILQKIFPEALFLVCQRDSRDTALSQRMTRFARVRWNLSWDHQLSRFALFYELFQKLMNENTSNLRMIHYEKLATDIRPEIEPLLSTLGLGWDANCLNFHTTQRQVHTASSAQVRQPLYQTSIGKFQNYIFAYGVEFKKLNEIQKNAILNDVK
ncbi:MAG: tetratricopeptide repeat-containing sulfotransferase family protein [bacterium]